MFTDGIIGAGLPAPHPQTVGLHVLGYRRGNCQKEQFRD